MDSTLDKVFVWAAVILFGGSLVLTLDWPLQTALFPRTIGIAGFAVALFSAFRLLQRRGVPDDEALTEALSAGEVRAFVWATGFFAVVWLIGFQFGLPLVVGLYYFFEARLRLGSAAVAVLLTALAAWLVDTYLQVPLYEGVLLN